MTQFLKVRVPAPRFYFFHLMLRSYDDNIQPANLSLVVTLLSSEQCSQFKRFHQQHIKMVNKTSSFKTKLIGNNAQANRVKLSIIPFDV